MLERMTDGKRVWVRTTLVDKGKVVTPLYPFFGRFVAVSNGEWRFGGRLTGLRGGDLVLMCPCVSTHCSEVEVRFPKDRVECCYFDSKGQPLQRGEKRP